MRTKWSMATAALGALVLAIVPGGCPTTVPVGRTRRHRAASSKVGVVSCGGPYDEIYQEIYTPGRGTHARA